MRGLKEDEQKYLSDLVINDARFETRIRAHILLMYFSHLPFDVITKVYNTEYGYVHELVKYFNYFGLSNLIDSPYGDILKRNNEEEQRLEEERLKKLKRQKSLIDSFFWPFRAVFMFFKFFFDMLTFIVASVVSFFINFSSSLNFARASNYAKIEQGSSNNYIMRIMG